MLRRAWEYQVIESARSNPDSLSEAGVFGWELVSVLYCSISRRYTLFFKRDKR